MEFLHDTGNRAEAEKLGLVNAPPPRRAGGQQEGAKPTS